jgi:site-specific recombinase XerD
VVGERALVENALAAQLRDRLVTEHPVLAARPGREQLMAATWLAGYRSARTRQAYAADLAEWLEWLASHELDPLAATRVVADVWVRGQLDAGAAHSSVCRRLSAISSFYAHLLRHDLVVTNPAAGVTRPRVDPDHSATVGLSREQARALLAAADTDTGPQRLRSAAIARALLLNGLRVDELAGADTSDLGHDAGHQVLSVTRKGGRRTRVPLAPATAAALAAYLAERATLIGAPGGRGDGPLLATSTGRRLDQAALWRLVRRLARAAGIEHWAALSPHSLRHTAITLALDAGVSLRDVQDFAGHADPRTTRRYDRSRDQLDRNATYILAAYLTPA